MPRQLKVAVNATPLLFPLTGIGQYVFHLMQAMELADGEIEPQYFYGYGWSPALRAPNRPRVSGGLKEFVRRVVPRAHQLRRAIERRAFAQGTARLKPDLYHEPNFLPLDFDGPTVITVHDLSCFRYPETHPPQRVEAMRRLLPSAVDRAACILTDSLFVKQEVCAFFGIPPEKIVAIPLGVSPIFRPRDEHETKPVLSRWGLHHGRYLLAVGTLEPRKNLVQVLRAYLRLPPGLRLECPLVVAGMAGWKAGDIAAEISQLAGLGQLRILGYVPEEDLPALYAGSTALVYPSLYEGFGLPPLEAMASGVPVITSGQASLPEVVGDAGLVFHPEDVNGLSEAMLALLEDVEERRRLAEFGLKRARQFSWRKCAEETVAVYQAVAAK